MAYIHTIPEDEASGELAEIYEAERKAQGYVPNHVQIFSLHPEAIGAWRNLLKTVRGKMRLRRYELVTFAAAAAMKCTY